MSETDPLAFLRNRRLAEVAADSRPAWLWAADGSRILWANAVGAALLDASAIGDLVERRFSPRDPAVLQVLRLAASLPTSGVPRLERLRGFGSSLGRLLTCSCRRLAAPDETPAIFIAATEQAGPSLPLVERVRRMLDAARLPFAAFSPDGKLLHADSAARERLAGAATLAGAGIADLANAALAGGHAAGATAMGDVRLDRIGVGTNAVLIATFAPAPAPPPLGERRGAAPQHGVMPQVAADESAPAPETPPQAPPQAGVDLDAARTGVTAAERRQPLRFVWQIDAEGRFTVASDAFVALMGPAIASVLGRPWTEVAAALALDPEGRLAEALAPRETFGGIAVAWPAGEEGERLAVELSGFPIFDGDRAFGGYRGFGICRYMGRLAAIASSGPPALAPQSREPDENMAEPVSVENAPDAPRSDEGAQTSPAAAATGGEAARAAPPGPERPLLTLVPPSKNVVPFRPVVPAATDRRPPLNPAERNAFQEIAKALGARIEEADAADREPPEQPAPGVSEIDLGQEEGGGAAPAEPETPGRDEGKSAPGSGRDEGKSAPGSGRAWPRPIPSAYAAGNGAAPLPPTQGNGERAVLDRVPTGVLICRGDRLLLVNRALLEWTGYADLDAIAAAGGLERLLLEPGLAALGEGGGSGQRLALMSRQGDALPVDGRLFSVPWHDGSALLLVFTRTDAQEQVKAAEEAVRAAERRIRAAEASLATSDERLKATELALRASQASTRELESVLETATDGMLVVDRDGMILAGNRSAEALFGYEASEIARRSFVDLFAPESHRIAMDYLESLMREGVASVLNDGREVIGRVRQGGLIPLFMTIGRVTDDKFCVVFRDITQWKRAEEDLINARREAEKTSSAKSDVLAKVSHEIRTPLNAIIGFAEVMLEERFGPVGNDRYRQYLKDIRASGEHVISLVNDLLDLSKIEAGKLELNFVSVMLNDVLQQCVAIMQPQANRERIIIRTSLLPTLPPVVADERSIRQIVLNLLSNSIKFTGAGGQVIVSTALTDQGEAVLRVRDTGIGMSEKDIETALEPFRQITSSGRARAGTGLGLPLTKVLAEANRATFTIKSALDAGTLVEIVFPATRVLAE